MAMSTKCTICTNDRRADIDYALEHTTVPVTRVAADFGVHPAALARHVHNGHVLRKAVARKANAEAAVSVAVAKAMPSPAQKPAQSGARTTQAPAIPPDVDTSPIADVPPLGGRERLVAVAAKLEAEAVLRGGMRPDIARELRLTYEALHKMDGGVSDREVRVADVQGLPELFGAMFKALEPFPDARRALGAVFAEHGVF